MQYPITYGLNDLVQPQKILYLDNFKLLENDHKCLISQSLIAEFNI
jgi:hypothetical protein